MSVVGEKQGYFAPGWRIGCLGDCRVDGAPGEFFQPRQGRPVAGLDRDLDLRSVGFSTGRHSGFRSAVISAHDPRDERMADHVGIGEADLRHALDPAQKFDRFVKP